QTILLSTIPVKLAGSAENTVTQNKNLKLYADAISSVATKRKKRFVDIYTPLAQHTGNIYLDNGIHLNGAGYYYLAQVLEESFGWPPRETGVAINAGKSSPTASGPAKVLSKEGGKITFTIEESLLPFPVADSGQPAAGTAVSIQVTGLDGGFYTLV